jgi:thymidylate synthase
MDQKELFQDIYRRLKTDGKFCSPRGLKIIECENFAYELPPYVCFANFEDRKLSIPYAKQEFRWYLKGDLHDLSIAEHAKIWRGIIVDGKLNSNYGHYIFRKKQTWEGTNFTGPGFSWVIDELKRDKDSRRAYVMILGNEHLNPKEKDVPCTLSLGFRIREDKLNMSVRMRSQDAIYGMGNDAPAFSFIHQMVHAIMRFHYPGLELGTYHHVADSFHVYERHFEMLEKIIAPEAEFYPVQTPKIFNIHEVEYLIGMHEADLTQAPRQYQFVEWLTT